MIKSLVKLDCMRKKNDMAMQLHCLLKWLGSKTKRKNIACGSNRPATI